MINEARRYLYECLDELMRCLGMFMGCQIRPRLWVMCVCTCKRPRGVQDERERRVFLVLGEKCG